jgi:hypothetical protein
VLRVGVLAILAGCVHPTRVERAYDGDVVEGRFVDPEAYAAFLRGAIAEASGHHDEALAAYGDAAMLEPASPEVWTRIGDVRCQVDPRGSGAEDALSRALALEPGYAPAWAVRARCALQRGDASTASAAAARAAALDAGADGSNVMLARTSAGAAQASLRARLVALTATARDPVVAWDALTTWAAGCADVPLWARALRELARIAPARRVSIARASEQLAGLGELGEARAVAAAAADAEATPLPDGTPLAALLAVDDAISTHDLGTVRARATRVRVALDEVAGRALLAGDHALARELAEPVARGDPGAFGARLVLAASSGGDLVAAASATQAGSTVPAGALVAFGMAFARAAPRDEVRRALGRISASPLVSGDDRIERAAVELVSRGVLDAEKLPPNGAVELAALKGEPPSSASAGLDVRHEFLALALEHPDGQRTLELAKRLASIAASDPVVGSAAALLQLAVGAPIPPGAPGALLARNAADPLLAAMALRLAERVGDREVARRARQTLTALGRAPAPGAGLD